jgi:23S rRNA pseudouridine1911/1915/1917 synthase
MKQINSATGVGFFRVDGVRTLTDFLLSRDYSPLAITCSRELIAEWLEYGSVYVDGRRQRVDIPLIIDQVIRVHTRRKHYGTDFAPLRNRLVEDNEHFLVLDKPSGLPTHPTLDNYIENAKTLLERELQMPLFTTHRLDIPTQGLLIIAKTPDAQWRINRLFSVGRVHKVYRSRNWGRVPAGTYTHYMDPESRVPKQLSSELHDDWWKCQLRVDASVASGALFNHEMTLLTGKTHQIRAQMLALNASIVGDPVYRTAEHATDATLALECFQLTFTLRAQNYKIQRPSSILGPNFSPV